jgi:hypothetical protein
VFSRNSASSRAIPFRKQVERVMQHPAYPVSWPEEQRGMSGGDEIDPALQDESYIIWDEARNYAVQSAQRLADMGVHKSVTNRLLEPFMWQTVILTGTEWSGFWEQRCSPLAQPEIRVAAEAMQAAYEDSTPSQLDYGQWHLPLFGAENAGTEQDWDDVMALADSSAMNMVLTSKEQNEQIIRLACAVSAARCARVSYLTHDGQRSLEADLNLFQRLVTAQPGHWSPLEHVATPKPSDDDQVGNLIGWNQLRHMHAPLHAPLHAPPGNRN